jgi:hypothetical protein
MIAIVFVAGAAIGADEHPTSAPTTRPDTSRGDQMLADYFRKETAAIASRCLEDVKTVDDWNNKKTEYRRELFEMLGLWPVPEKTELHAIVTGKIDSEEFTVEKLHFQSRPHLYVTANLYLPKGLTKPAPAILYVCGHSHMKKNGVSFGNKTGYQHHGEWFARNGYVCMIIDTVELGEIEGVHHGSYNLGMWWWQSRGYTPAGVEAWSGIRALDYLCTRPEVDPTRIGITGRSGGGAYSWYIAALDERVKVAAPVAGITDLQNHVVDGCVEGHCDCMYLDNTYRWDYPQVAALISPRPLLIGNSDKDTIFPLDGVYRLHEQVRRIYKLQGAEKNLGLLITEGPHKDTQDLQVPVFRWFNRFLKSEAAPIDKVATSFFEPRQLRVFDQLPTDQINTKIQETFVPGAAAPLIPHSQDEWNRQRDNWLAKLREKTFAGWPSENSPAQVKEVLSVWRDGVKLRAFDMTTQHDVRLRLYVTEPTGRHTRVILSVMDEPEWEEWLGKMRSSFADGLRDEPSAAVKAGGVDSIRKRMEDESAAIAWFAPRGVGMSRFTADVKKRNGVLRRFALLGQTLDGMRVWDVRQAVNTIGQPLSIEASGRFAGIALYAALFEPKVAELDLHDLPASHRNGPELLNVLQILDMPQALAIAASQARVRVDGGNATDWEYPTAVARTLNWSDASLRIMGRAE